MALEDASLGETGVGIPDRFETTKQRVGVRSEECLSIEIELCR